jgi:hypothetical protein
MKFRRLGWLVAGISLAAIAQPAASQSFKPGLPVGDQNPSPTYCKSWDTGSSSWIACPASSGGSGGGGGAVTAASGAYAAGSIVDLGTGASPAANTVNARLLTLDTDLNTLLKPGGAVTISGTPAINNAQIGGVSVATGVGASNAGTQRVAVASDSSLTANIGTTNGLALDTSVNSLFKANQTIGNVGFAAYGSAGTAFAQGAGAADLNTQRVTPADGAVVPTTPVSAANTALFTVNLNGYGGVGFNLYGTFSATVTFQYSDDNANWSAATISYDTGGSATTTATAAGAYFASARHNYFRAIVLSGAYTSGTVSSAATLRASNASNTSSLSSSGSTIGAVILNPSATTGYGISAVTLTGVTANLVKSSAGNLYGINATQPLSNGVAGYVVAYDAAAAPASGAALTASLIRWNTQIGAQQTIAMQFDIPYAFTNGIVLLATTSLSTYTPLTATLAALSGQAK